MTNELFHASYELLNPRQKEAVDAVEGPVMVIAGPGTGKTQILTLRIANILERTDAAPENILALTFTESAAANMRKRLVGLIGTPGYYVNISTFHGFANRLIQEHPERFPRILGGRNATDVDQISLLRKIIEEKELEHLKPLGDKFFYVREILTAIRHLKSEGISAEDLRRSAAEVRKRIEGREDLRHEKGKYAGAVKSEYQKQLKSCAKNEELAMVYEAYDALLAKEHLYDFEDMLLQVVDAFEKDQDFLLEVEENYHYVLVDEHQDTNGAQNKILELITSFFPSPNLFVVGDEKQAIFRFQGASLENFLYFKNKFPEARLISLEDNYRSTQAVLDSATAVIEENPSTLKAPLKAVKGGEARPVMIYRFDVPEAEHFFVAQQIKDMVQKGIVPGEIAVLYRDNRDADPVKEALEREGIPFALESDQNLLEDEDIRKLIRLLRAVNELGRDELLAEALHIDFLEVPPLDIWKLLRARADRRGKPLADLLLRPDLVEPLELAAGPLVLELGRKLSAWKRKGMNEHFLQFFPELIRESGYLAHILQHPGYFEKVARLNAFFDEAKKAAGARGDFRLQDLLEYLSILQEHNVMIRSRGGYLPNAVRLMTAHRAKGLEFDEVFIVGATDGHWGNRRSLSHFDLPFRTGPEGDTSEKNEDERRLFYMAMTRARQGIWITYAAKDAEGRERVPSQFLAEIRGDLKEEKAGTDFEAKLRREGSSRFSEVQAPLPRLEDKEFLAELFEKRGLSATALNNYLECPWKYLYRNLLQLPEMQTNYQMYGIAVHRALERYFKAKAEGEPVGKTFLLERFEEELSREPLPDSDLRSILARGKKTLGAYFDNYASSWNYRTLTEFKADAKIGDVHITGKLDKLELGLVPNEVVVVDYKVKQPMTRNAIEGGTKSSNGDYKRQLVFYKLLLDNLPSNEGASGPRFKMREAVIDFVEPNDRGVFKAERFEIGEAEALALQEEIQRVAAEILSLSFWDRSCGEKDCEYCALRNMLNRP